MSSVWTIARQTLKECRRRRVFLLVPLMTLGFLALYALGNYFAFRESADRASGIPVDTQVLAGATLVGLAMFVTLFLGSALAIFLTFNTIRGETEIGTLQQLVVRPVARYGMLVGRFLGASLICVTYSLVLYFGSVLVTGFIGDWWPDPWFLPGLQIGAGVVVVAALTLLGSAFMTSLANGIVMFMVYGAGLLAGLLGQLGEGLNSSGLSTTGRVVSYIFPFEALYQSGLHSLTSATSGLERVVVQLGPLGGAQEGGAFLSWWVLVYVVGVLGSTIAVFNRRDL